MSRAVAFVQARMTSSRLPGKVLERIGGRPSIVFMVQRLRRARTLDDIVIVTSDDPTDDELADAVSRAGFAVFRGALNDVLARFHGALREYPAEEVVRVTGDCPLLDPALVDAVVTLRRQKRVDYASNVEPPTFPDGMDVEVFTASSLRQAHTAARLPSEREHVTPWMRRPGSHLRRANLPAVSDFSGIRLTVDYPDDLLMVRELVARLGPLQDDFDMFDILRCIQHEPMLLCINRHARNEGLAKSQIEDPLLPLATLDPSNLFPNRGEQK